MFPESQSVVLTDPPALEQTKQRLHLQEDGCDSRSRTPVNPDKELHALFHPSPISINYHARKEMFPQLYLALQKNCRCFDR